MFEKGQMVRIEFVDEYGHECTETAEVELVTGDGSLVRTTFMAYGEDKYVSVPPEKCTLLTARVVTGWNVTHDFETMEEALQFAAEQAREPVRDPALRRVVLIDMTEHDKKWGFRRSITVECPLAGVLDRR